MLPPGRLMLDTRPIVTGSNPVTKIIGMLVVASLAARTASALPTIAAGLRATSSAASCGNAPADLPPNGIRLSLCQSGSPIHAGLGEGQRGDARNLPPS